MNPAKKKNAKRLIVNLDNMEREDEMVIQCNHDILHAIGHPALMTLHEDLVHFIARRSELIKALTAEVKNLSGTLQSFAELDEVMEANKPQTACHSTQTCPAPSCKETSSQTDPIKPATPAPAAIPAKKPASTLPAPAPTKRKQSEAPNPPAKRTNLNGPSKPAPSRVSKPAAAQVGRFATFFIMATLQKLVVLENRDMELKSYTNTDHVVWRCRSTSKKIGVHSIRTSLRCGTWFEKSTLKLHQIITMTALWVVKIDIKTNAEQSGVSDDAVTHWVNFCREVCYLLYLDDPPKIGGTTIISDGFRSYYKLDQEGFDHLVVNHKLHFKDPETGAHTNNIEATWGAAKKLHVGEKGKDMELKSYTNTDHVVWRCRSTSKKIGVHSIRTSLRCRTWFEKSTLKLHQIITMTAALWVVKIDIKTIVEQSGVSDDAVTHWVNFCREVCYLLYLDDPPKIGGKGKQVQIDESLFGHNKKTKNHCAKTAEGHWIDIKTIAEQSGVSDDAVTHWVNFCREVCYLLYLDDPPKIGGTTIISDGFRSYYKLDQEGFDHLVVNHKLHFKDPETGAHTNNIEATWGAAKKLHVGEKGKDMELKSYTNTDHVVWRCRSTSKKIGVHSIRTSLRCRTWFEKSTLKLHQIITMTAALWVVKIDIKTIAEQSGVSDDAVTHWVNFCREVCYLLYLDDPPKIGGKGKQVQIDESLFGHNKKTKNHCAKTAEGHWIDIKTIAEQSGVSDDAVTHWVNFCREVCYLLYLDDPPKIGGKGKQVQIDESLFGHNKKTKNHCAKTAEGHWIDIKTIAEQSGVSDDAVTHWVNFCREVCYLLYLDDPPKIGGWLKHALVRCKTQHRRESRLKSLPSRNLVQQYKDHCRAVWDHVVWRCRSTSKKIGVHSIRTSLRCGTWFEKSTLKLHQIITMTALWVVKIDIKTIAEQSGVSDDAVTHWVNFCREVCYLLYLDDPPKIGGKGKQVQIDESLFGHNKKTKNHCAKTAEGLWIDIKTIAEQSGVSDDAVTHWVNFCREVCYLLYLDDPPKIGGTTIISDGFRSYYKLDQEGFDHLVVNHKLHFKDPETGAHTNNIEATWGAAKKLHVGEKGKDMELKSYTNTDHVVWRCRSTSKKIGVHSIRTSLRCRTWFEKSTLKLHQIITMTAALWVVKIDIKTIAEQSGVSDDAVTHWVNFCREVCYLLYLDDPPKIGGKGKQVQIDESLFGHNKKTKNHCAKTAEGHWHCGRDMELKSYTNTDHVVWRCRSTSKKIGVHSIRTSLRCGTWFEKSTLKLHQIITMTALWVVKIDIKTIAEQSGVSDDAVTHWVNFCREVCYLLYLDDPPKIGGKGKQVQIDESLFGHNKKTKNHCAKTAEGHWVFGGVDVETKDFFFQVVADRRARTLIAVIKKYVLPGTTIISDGFRSYYKLDQEGFDHLVVNHKLHFKDPETGAHTNNIEATWGAAKKLHVGKRKVKDSLEFYLSEYWWRRKHYIDIKTIAEQSGVSDDAVTHWVNFCREVCYLLYLDDPPKIGGKGKQVVADRRARTLIAVIKKYVLPGTTIISDGFRSYYKLDQEGFDHLVVNHKLHFKDPETGAHTNNIEATWGAAKKLHVGKRKVKDSLEFYLSEYWWRRKHYIDIKTIAEQSGVSDDAVTHWVNFCREVCYLLYLDDPPKIGGKGKQVQIDECLFGHNKKTKNHCAKTAEGHWVFGGVDVETKDFFFQVVADRRARTLIAVIKKYVLPGTTIISDGFRSYYKLDQEGFDHLVVNHKLHFKDPETGAHTNNIEATWGAAKKLHVGKRKVKDSLEFYLSEYWWRRKHYIDIKTIAEQSGVSDDAVTHWVNFCREVCYLLYLDDPPKIGGKGKQVQIDESLFGHNKKTKNHCAKTAEGHWCKALLLHPVLIAELNQLTRKFHAEVNFGRLAIDVGLRFIRQIAADIHLGASTLHRLWRRWLVKGNEIIYRNACAARGTSARMNRRILRQEVADLHVTCTSILQNVQDTLAHSISTRTIFRRLVAFISSGKKTAIDPTEKMPTVVLSDESRFCLSSDSSHVRVRRRRGEKSNPADFVERPTARQL
ncbi:hypothetical protein LAZ67_6001230 [Cordylochernes scorpioides]|uniref:ISXO2-like transposase domain-containing protein n=1 Tax=Cordylochernes scorpioides TaxID=51811 RepID=A0ABY6KKA5_9ARAC|nr:hypothetical protein LAZ67_6001230 [Cordylochernes scorpioides]